MNTLKGAKENYEKAKKDLKDNFSQEAFESELKRNEKHLQFIEKKRSEKIKKKIQRDHGGGVTINNEASENEMDEAPRKIRRK